MFEVVKLTKSSDLVLKQAVFCQHTKLRVESQADISVPSIKCQPDFTREVGKQQNPVKYFREPKTFKYPDSCSGIIPGNQPWVRHIRTSSEIHSVKKASEN